MKYATGGNASKLDVRDYTYKPGDAPEKGGERYTKKYIHDQHRVGICTAIALTTLAHKITGKQYSPDFNYLLQKKYIDGNWNEGSSTRSALKAAHRYGMILEKDFEKYITEDDRKLTYAKYIKKLQAIPEEEIWKLLKKSIKPEGYAKVPLSEKHVKAAINENKGGLLVRYVIGSEWWRRPILPLRPAKTPISGHIVVHSDYDKDEIWVANSWGADWAEDGSGYSLWGKYEPTEAWSVFFKEIPKEVNKKVTLNQVIRLLKWLKNMGHIK